MNTWINKEDSLGVEAVTPTSQPSGSVVSPSGSGAEVPPSRISNDEVQEGVKLTLEGAQASFISYDRLVMSLKSGELFVLTLYADSMRSIRSFHFEKAAASVLTTCMCVCEENYLFLGSRLGNSLLLRFIEKEQSLLPVVEEKAAPKPDHPSKKKRLDTLGDWMASDVSDIRDLDELEVYGSEAQTSLHIASYIFEVCDSLLNIGPCGNISMGEPAFLSEEFSTNEDPDIELFTTSGYGKNGALCVLQRSIRPQVVTTFELPGCVDMWTVIGGKEPVDDASSGEHEYTHSFMILSQHESTMILKTGQEINEVDHSGFSTQGPTVYAGNLGYNRFIIQVNYDMFSRQFHSQGLEIEVVSPMGVRLLQGLEQLQHIPLDLGSAIVHASSADPHVVILSEDGQVILLTLRETRGQSRLTVTRPALSLVQLTVELPYLASKLSRTCALLQLVFTVTRPALSLRPHIVTLCAYRDVSGLFSTTLPEEELEVCTMTNIKVEEDTKKEVDDEDKMLYGEADSSFDPPVIVETFKSPIVPTETEKTTPCTNDSTTPEPSTSQMAVTEQRTRLCHQYPTCGPLTHMAEYWWKKYLQEIKPTYWLFLVRENGNMEMYTLPDFQQMYLVRNFGQGLRVLADSTHSVPSSMTADTTYDTEVQEILVVALGLMPLCAYLQSPIEGLMPLCAYLHSPIQGLMPLCAYLHSPIEGLMPLCVYLHSPIQGLMPLCAYWHSPIQGLMPLCAYLHSPIDCLVPLCAYLHY
uniref:RSE1/DDB1/CPSF1 second beta-propeller domain-containing protein n=1 Tax=Timema shepardi TaxID=629360 RepID=A0A7R9B6L2_TIMSH|nr:unnamed protein product [Timema shepardi]